MEPVNGLIEFIYRGENSGKVDYNVVFNGIAAEDRPKKPITQMTVGEVLDWQASIDHKYNSEAAGAGQFMEDTLRDEVRRGTVSADDMFDNSTQDRLTVSLMRQKGLDSFLDGGMTPEDFGTNLARVWASLPVLKDTFRNGRPISRGSAYYGGVGANSSRAAHSEDDFLSVLTDPAASGLPGEFLSSRNTSGGGTLTDPAGTVIGPDASERLGRQALLPEPPEPILTQTLSDPLELSGERPGFTQGPPGPVQPDLPPQGAPRPPLDIGTRTGPGGGGVTRSPFQAFTDEVTDSFIVRKISKEITASKFEFDAEFDPVALAVSQGLDQHIEFLAEARNEAHFNSLKLQIKRDADRNKRRAVGEQLGAELIGGIANPDNLILLAVPGGVVLSASRRAGTSALRSAASAGALTLGGEAAVESGRAPLDPFSSELDSAIRIGGTAILGAALGGAAGGLLAESARRGLANELASDIARSSGVPSVSKEVKIGERRFPVVFDDGPSVAVREGGEAPTPKERFTPPGNRGVSIADGEVRLNASRIIERLKEGDHPQGITTATDLAEFEIARTASLFGKLREFASDEGGSVTFGRITPKEQDAAPLSRFDQATGETTLNRPEIQRKLDAGETFTFNGSDGSPGQGKNNPIRLKAEAFKTVEDVEDVIRQVDEANVKARDQGEFETMLGVGDTAGRGRRDEFIPDDLRKLREEDVRAADDAAAEALEKFREKNNKILQKDVSAALARLSDGPFKRTARRALSSITRDLNDKLAADGAFLRKSDATGLTIGPSVHSRAKTWDGVVRVLDNEFIAAREKYLGFERNPDVAGVAFNGRFRNKRADGARAISREDFAARATHAVITGEKDAIPEVMQFAEAIRRAFDEFGAVAEEFGVISSKNSIKARRKALRERLDTIDPDSEDFAAVKARMDELDAERSIADQEPDEGYFTRVYNARNIAANRDLFKDRVVKPFMRREPRGQVWVVGKDELQDQLDLLRSTGADQARIDAMQARFDSAPDKTGFQWKQFSTKESDIDARAEEMIDTILGEGEPEELGILREANRPVFGRLRQFNIPNAMLLKGGQKGNGVADFIETDPLLVMKIYADRMGPAIEMARSFSRPTEGISAARGFGEAIDASRAAEIAALRKSGKIKGDNSAADRKIIDDHWRPIQRDLVHLRDRVTNRVIRSPDRWDNRSATALRNWSHLALMGSSAISAVVEVGMLVSAHGARRIWQNAFQTMDGDLAAAVKNNILEVEKAGAILDVAMATSLSRMAETGMDARMGTAPERWLRTASNKFFLWNGLAPLTTRLKEIDAGIRVQDTVERISRVGLLQKSADPSDLEELARFGISREDAIRMSNEPIFQTEEGGFWQANTAAWGDEGLVRKFRAAIAQGSENTILLATAADKPTIVDGVAFIRSGPRVDKFARKLGLKEEGGFYRVQSGMATLPFTFWNYALAAHNKILLANLDQPSAQKLGGLAAMIGLGYMAQELRTPQFIWDKMSATEKLIASIDQSGMMGVISQTAGLAERGTISSTLSRAAGAPFTVAGNAVGGVVNGDLNQFSKSVPWQNHIMLRDLIDAAVDGIERSRSGLDAAAG